MTVIMMKRMTADAIRIGLTAFLLSNHHWPSLERLAAEMRMIVGRVIAASAPV